MVDYDTAAAVVAGIRTPIRSCWPKSHTKNPEFGANVAANPRAYPGLKRWIAEFGDQRARDFLAGMGITAQGDPVRPREQAGSDGPDSAVNDTPASDVPPANDPSSDAGTDRHLPGDDYDDKEFRLPGRGAHQRVRRAAVIRPIWQTVAVPAACRHQPVQVHRGAGADHRRFRCRSRRSPNTRLNCVRASHTIPTPIRRSSTGWPSCTTRRSTPRWPPVNARLFPIPSGRNEPAGRGGRSALLEREELVAHTESWPGPPPWSAYAGISGIPHHRGSQTCR